MLLLQTDENFTWLAPYAYAIVLLGFAIVLFRIFEIAYASYRNRPLYRDLRIFRKLDRDQVFTIQEEFPFYNRLTAREQRRFQHRVATFLKEKNFIGRQDMEVTSHMKLLIASLGCLISFGRKNHNYHLISHILVYPGEFYSNINKSYHKGELNPREKALVLSWPDFERCLRSAHNTVQHIGIHEFMHAMQMEAHRGKDIDSSRFAREFGEILKALRDEELRTQLEATAYFKAYNFANQYQFMAVLAQYFFESPTDLKQRFPVIYDHTRNLFNMRYGGY